MSLFKKRPFPFRLPTGEEIKTPAIGMKKCNYLIIGPPDCGKSKWMNETFDMCKIYKPASGKHPFDMYNDEELMILDDVIIGRDQLFNFLNVHNTPSQIDARYYQKLYKPKQKRMVIMLANEDNLPTYVDDPAFQARFHTINLYPKKIAEGELFNANKFEEELFGEDKWE